MSFEAQKQIRENTMELQEFLKDLNQWETRVKEKDKELKSKPRDGVSDTPPIRGRSETVPQAGLKREQLQRQHVKITPEVQALEQSKRTINGGTSYKTSAQHTYDKSHAKWEKFDVEAALREADGDELAKEVGNEKEKKLKKMEQIPSTKSGTASVFPVAFKPLPSDSFTDSTSEKDLGNKYFKEKKFVQAIDCYSRSIGLQPSSVAYANRAMAYIKIRRFKEAEVDCTEAIALDDHYVKAYARRSTARKELGNYLGALEDAEFALRLEPDNKELKEQYATVKEMCKKITDMKHIEKKHSVAIEEIKREEPIGAECKDIPDSSDQKGALSRDESHQHISKKPLVSQQLSEKMDTLQAAVVQASAVRVSTHTVVEAPRSFYEFEAAWKSFSSSPVQQSGILKIVKPSNLPNLFKDNLSPKLLVDMIRCLQHLFPEHASHAIEVLENLTKARRFNLTVMCLSSKEKSELRELWENVFLGDGEKNEILKDLQSKYQLE